MKKQNQNKKVILAFSGGLDTSFCVPYLIDKGYQVITVTVDSGGFSSIEKKEIANKSKELGAVKHYLLDSKNDYFQTVIQWIIKTNGLFEGSYPNIVSSQRYDIVKKCIEIASIEKAQYIANGNSGMGNDQIRFNLTLKTLAPDIELIEPIKDTGGDRKEEEKYLEKKGFFVNKSHKKYSINVSLMGITYSGSEIDNNLEADKNIFKWVTGEYINKEGYFEVEFKKGLPIKLNSKKIDSWQILDYLNHEVGKYGFGKNYYTGDCMIGIKGHIAFEAPGILFLIKAHQALEQYVLSKPQIYFGQEVSNEMTEYIFNGKFYDPYVNDLKAFVNSQQKNVSGKVLMKIEHGNVLPVSVISDFSLINPKIATYAQSKSWTKEEVNGFIKLYGLQSVISSKTIKKGENNHGS